MRKRDKRFWIAYLIFAVMMVLNYIYVPAETKFIVIIVLPLAFWFVYEFILRPKKKGSE
ncbi:hypothetical protein ACFC4S_23220 [Priestia megaterium]|uniref:hypothetical protein n=1 Tax=Priestia megaterium TaxID=1404 RepID=UPI0035D70C8D